MLTNDEKVRYQRQTMLPEIGMDGQQKLKQARVAVVGAGGLGSPVLLYLAAAGVGTLGIIDGDTVSLSNLQRQVLYTQAELGEMKVTVARRKLELLNPHVCIEEHPQYITAANALAVLGRYDLIIDGSDNFDTRYLVNDACVLLDKPMISGAIFRFEGQVSVFNYHNGPTYRCIFPEPPGDGESPNCADIGVVASLPGIIGTIQANEAIKIITGAGQPLSGRLLVLDALTMQSHTFTFSRNPQQAMPRQLTDRNSVCDIPAYEITFYDLKQKMLQPGTQLIDVRDPAEHAAHNIGGINIPLSTLQLHAAGLVKNDIVITYCLTGKRSNAAVNLLSGMGFSHVYSLQGGIGNLRGSSQ